MTKEEKKKIQAVKLKVERPMMKTKEKKRKQIQAIKLKVNGPTILK